jgi:hypothetical protein
LTEEAAKLFSRRAKSISKTTSGTLITVTNTIARAISAANVCQFIEPPKILPTTKRSGVQQVPSTENSARHNTEKPNSICKAKFYFAKFSTARR